MGAIGILGGMGPQASNKLYELIIKKTANYTNAAIDEDYPEIVLLSVPVPNFISDKEQLPKALEMLLEKTKLLEQAGCTINGIACNTVHLLLPELQASTSVTFVSVPQLVSEKIKLAKYKRVGLLATPTTLQSTLYDNAISTAEIIRPNKEMVAFAEECIYAELSGQLSDAQRKKFRIDLNKFKSDNQLDTVILGCTELPLVFGGSQYDESIIDTLDVLADGLLEQYFSNTKRITLQASGALQ